MNYESAKEKLSKYGQEHVLKYYDELSENSKKALLEQIENTDFEVLKKCNELGKSGNRGEFTPLKAMQLAEIEAQREEFEKVGIETIKAGKTAAVLLAGGMGTRLGSDNPKGMYDIGITRNVYIFQRLFENLMDSVNAAGGAYIHLFIMTSDKNHDKTVAFLKEKNYFGYDEKHITFFKQEMAAATDRNGKIYLEEKGRVSTSPNGNGGWFASMIRTGAIERVKSTGIEWLNVFAVDNVLQRIADPVFVGATINHNCEIGAKVVKKAARDEKVGVMCLEDDKPSIVEYYELDDKMMDEIDPETGERAYNYGVILNYLFNVKALFRVADMNMPLHVVEKKIQYVDDKGAVVKPEEPNGYKYESLVLDMIHMMDSCLPFEVKRNYEFAPVKNKTGVDSVESARALCKENGIEL